MTPEFSIPVSVGELSPRGGTIQRSATPRQRDDVARRLGLTSLEELAAELTLQPDDTDGTVRAVGHLTARYTQPCSVTLEPLTSTVEVPVDITYAPEEDLGNQSDDESDLDLDEPPEPIVDGVFDVGETLVQLLALEIDPFPRTPDLPFEDFTDAGDPGPAASPFAALAVLKKKLDNP